MKTVKFLIILAMVIAIGCGGSTAFRSGKTYFYQHKDYEQAEEAFRLAIQEEPDNWEAYLYLGLSLAEQSKFEEAKGHFLSAREKAPDDEKKMQAKEQQSDKTVIDKNDKYDSQHTDPQPAEQGGLEVHPDKPAVQEGEDDNHRKEGVVQDAPPFKREAQR